MTDVWSFSRVFGEDRHDHATPKSVEVVERILRSSCIGSVLDPFLGSGPTLVVAQQEGRTCHGMEITPAYVDVSVTRWQDYTNEEAILDGTGQTFAEVKAERLPRDVAQAAG